MILAAPCSSEQGAVFGLLRRFYPENERKKRLATIKKSVQMRKKPVFMSLDKKSKT